MTQNIAPQDARQGRKSRRVVKVLVAALALTAVAWVVLEYVWS
ncbi:hypothetical protein [Ahrensia sp. R2A130]|nr:hypothetical protein [Ahrensia sp. R2A130]EFL87754.1 hypothetical protein R2A130_3252 [Ahrensia sp. R2A130]